MLRKLLIQIVLIFVGFAMQAQNVDSLFSILSQRSFDDTKFGVYYKLVSYYSYRDPSRAIDLAKSGLKEAVIARDSVHIAKFYGMLARQFCIMGDFLYGLDYGYKSLIIWELLGDKRHYYKHVLNLSRCYATSTLSDDFFYSIALEAEDYYTQQQDFASLLKVELYKLSKLRQAKKSDTELIRKILGLIKAIKGEKLRVLAYCDIGDYYKVLGNPDKALASYKHGELISTQDITKGYSKLKLATLYLEQNNIAGAEALLKQVLDIYTRLDDKVNLSKVYLQYAKYYSILENYAKAIEYTQRAYRLAVRYGLNIQISESLLQLADIYTKLGFGDLALQTYHRYNAIRDSVFSLNKFYPVISRQITLNEIQQKQENLILRREKEQQQHINRRQRIMLLIITLMSTVLLVMFVLLLKMFKRDRAANERLLKFAQISLEGIVILEKDKISEVNDKFVEQTLYTHDELIGRSFYDLFEPANRSYLEKIFTSEASLYSDLEIIRKDGSKIVVEILSRTLLLSNKKVIVISVHDITRYLQATQELIETQIRFRTLLDASPDGVIIVNSEEKLEFLSRSAFETIGLSPEKHSWSNDILEQLPPDKKALLEHIIEATLSEGSPDVVEIEFNRDGSKVYVECRASKMQNIHGDDNGYFIIMREITERRLTELALQKSEARFRGLFNTAKDGIIIQDAQGRIIDANPSVSKIFNYSRRELIGNLFSNLLPWRNKFEYDSLAVSDSVFETPAIKGDGQIIHIQISVSKLKFEDEKTYILIIRDITEFKKNQERLQRYAEKLQISNNSKTKLFSIIAHDLRGPIGNLKTMMEIILENPDDYDWDSMKEILQSLKETSVSTYELLENLLLWTKSQLNIIEYRPEVYDLGEVVSDILPLFSESLKRKNITLVNQIPASEVFVLIDLNMVKTILRNLIFNAIKFTPKNGKITLFYELKDDHVVIAVRDTGVGMTHEQMEKIFDENHFFSTYGTEKEKGTGLGLHLVSEFVQKNNGRIWVESEKGKGSTFYFTLRRG